MSVYLTNLSFYVFGESQCTQGFTVKNGLILDLKGVWFTKKLQSNVNLLSYVDNQTYHLKIFCIKLFYETFYAIFEFLSIIAIKYRNNFVRFVCFLKYR